MSPKAELPEKLSTSGTSILNKPLPQILDEIDKAINTLAEATRKAEAAVVDARQAAKEAADAATKAATAAVEGARSELLGKMAEMSKVLEADRANAAAVTKSLQDENMALRKDLAGVESRLNGRIGRLSMVVGMAGHAMSEVYDHPKNGLKSV